MAYDTGALDLQAWVKIRTRDVPGVDLGRDAAQPWTPPEEWEPGEPLTVETTLGRYLFNEALPTDYLFVNYEVRKSQLSAIVNDLAERYPKVQVAATLDALKEAGFHWATRSGVTIAITDVVTPPTKQDILEQYEDNRIIRPDSEYIGPRDQTYVPVEERQMVPS